MAAWLRWRFGRRWPLHLSNVLVSTVLVGVAWSAHVFWLAVILAAFWGMCVTNTALIFALRRRAERDGFLGDLVAMEEGRY